MQPVKMIGACVVSLPLFSGCATTSLTENECITGNWEAIGYEDGAAGRSVQRLKEHNEACAEVGVAPKYKEWERGRKQGLTQYCTKANAYRLGMRGRSLNTVCPISLMPTLDQINKKGIRYYQLDQQLKEERRLHQKYENEYAKMRAGDNLHFATEKEARSYFVTLHDKIKQSESRISHLETTIQKLQVPYYD